MVIILLSCLVLAGWLLDITVLKSVLPKWVAMKANSALAFLLASISLLILQSEKPDQLKHQSAYVCASMVMVIGVLSFGEYFFDWDLGIDQLLFRVMKEAVGSSYAGRMAPTTAVNFLLISTALLLIDKPKGYRIAQFLALITGLIGLLSFIGYAFGVTSIYLLAANAQMAIHTALAFILFSLALLFTHPDRGLMEIITNQTIGGMMLRRLLPAAIAVPFLVGWLRLIGERAGLYGLEFGLAIFTLSNIIILTSLILWNAGLLSKTDIERQQAEEETRELNIELEQRVINRTAELAAAIKNLENEITKRKLAEEDLRSARDDLEDKVAERIAELAVAKERAEEADRLKSAFLATMSHELRTPLNSIIGFTGIILQGMVGTLNEEQRKQLAMVKSSACHLLNLINEVLDLSKIGAGQMEIYLESFDLRSLINKTAQEMESQALAKRLTITTAIAPEVNEIISDPRRVEQILLNLVNNAIKFTEKGEIRIECRISDKRLLTSVADTGIGIKPEDIGKLFIAFQQLDSRLARRHQGSGLGLDICKRLTKLLGGEIHVESQWNVGSTFTLVLPYGVKESYSEPL